jgi:hypothetical protein
MKSSFQKIFRLPQSYFIFAGTGLGYLLFVMWLGMRSLVLIVGGAIALTMIFVWLWYIKDIEVKVSSTELESLETSDLSSDLLNREVFLKLLPTLEFENSKESRSTWQVVSHWAESSQTYCMKIAEQEPTLIPDLLDALHTVLALSQEIAETLQAMEQLQTSNYRRLAEESIRASCDRLKSSYEKLQNLHDQAILLKIPAARFDLPQQIKFLIEANEATLESHKSLSS